MQQRLPTFASLPIMMVQGKIGVSPWLHSLKLTFSHLKMDGWKMIFLLGPGLSTGAVAVSFREGSLKKS